jgi:sortase A
VTRARRLAGIFCVAAAALVGAWALVTWLWQDPFTALYTEYEQHQLTATLHREFTAYRPLRQTAIAGSVVQTEAERVAEEARRFRLRSHRGQALGRIIVPRMHLNMVFLDGADETTLQKGPGRYLGSAVPGEGQLVYIAGHRTTYLAPFSDIDQMRKGDRITLELPYATFVYKVTGYRIVPADDLAVLRSRGHELLELQACHPRFSATHRYLVYALPVRVFPRGGRAYSPAPTGPFRALTHVPNSVRTTR